MTDTENKAVISEWQVINLRLTTFYDDTMPLQFKQNEWFREVAGEDAETTITRRDLFQQEGNFGEGRLILGMPAMTIPQRVDWFYVSPTGLGNPFDNLENAISKFVPIMNKWLESSFDTMRIGLGSVSLLPAKDKESAYKQLASYLLAVKLEPDSSDFLYHINHPRRSKTPVEGLDINRLSKWMVSLSSEIGLSTASVRKNFSCLLETDMNTSAQYQGNLPKNHYAAILNELVTLTQEIVEKGDVK
ncbi:MAG: hypothetical protein AAB571_06685 [Chloroflexota bacterium]